ncbi:hypothetical protein FACS189452_08030 [Bacteroidia bacterium]|nr:hypothetical protein FACS189452_08030 [Bacteroidia bacterium]GHT81302.1 hypothetical protein FACS189467_5140 [Bacteroidia bacterium]
MPVYVDAQTVNKRRVISTATAKKKVVKKGADNERRTIKIQQPIKEADASVSQREYNNTTAPIHSSVVDKMISVASDPDVYIKYYVDRQMKLWQQRNSYEDLNMYKVRTQPTVKKAKFEEFFDKATSSYADLSMLTLGISGATLGEYDETNNTFLITFPTYGQIALKVKSEEAADFRNSWHRVDFSNIKFAPIKSLITGKSKIALSNITITNISNFKYYNWSIVDNAPHQKLPPDKMVITNLGDVMGNKIVIDTAQISDVDVIVPTRNKMPFTYALIIGNEYYKNLQIEPEFKMDASFAINDAVIFREYCNKILGVPLAQTKLLVNATHSQMLYGIEWLIDQLKLENGAASIIVYYAGLVLPDERTEEPFLLPVDYDNLTLLRAVGLENLYRRLSDYPLARTTVLLDARHKVKEREEEFKVEVDPFEDAKSKRSKNTYSSKPAGPKGPAEITLQPFGNTVTFASKASGENSGTSYDKRHGYFTYYLLKTIQETKGNITYRELQNGIYNNIYTGGGRRILPVTASEDIGDWEEWIVNRW